MYIGDSLLQNNCMAKGNYKIKQTINVVKVYMKYIHVNGIKNSQKIKKMATKWLHFHWNFSFYFRKELNMIFTILETYAGQNKGGMQSKKPVSRKEYDIGYTEEWKISTYKPFFTIFTKINAITLYFSYNYYFWCFRPTFDQLHWKNEVPPKIERWPPYSLPLILLGLDGL